MGKYIYDKNNGLWYEMQGGCHLSCLIQADSGCCSFVLFTFLGLFRRQASIQSLIIIITE